jgi:hypothetical protein
VSIPDKKLTDREITYRVGWKKGTIHVQEPVGAVHVNSSEAIAPEPATASNRLLQLTWKAFPYPAGKAAAVCMGVLPLAAFAAIVWLVSKLSQG